MEYKQDFKTLCKDCRDRKFVSAKILEVPFATPNIDGTASAKHYNVAWIYLCYHHS